MHHSLCEVPELKFNSLKIRFVNVFNLKLFKTSPKLSLFYVNLYLLLYIALSRLASICIALLHAAVSRLASMCIYFCMLCFRVLSQYVSTLVCCGFASCVNMYLLLHSSVLFLTPDLEINNILLPTI